jgi:hypothetical protein
MGITREIGRWGVSALGALGDTVAGWAGDRLDKAVRADSENSGDSSDRTPAGSDEDTAASNPVPTEKAEQDPKSLMWDPFALVEQLGYKDKPSPITYGTLRAMTFRMPIVQAIIQTRLKQVESFCVPQPDEFQLGFKIKLRESKKQPTSVERDWITQMETILMRTGVTDNPRGRDGMEDFAKKLIKDSLLYDQMCFEVVPNRKGIPAEWYAVDASTIRLADSVSAQVNEDISKAIKTVQIYDGVIINEYTQEELCFGIRNPSSDIRLQGYGTSELEMLIPTITSLLYAWDFNQKFFTQGSTPKGVINFKGAIPEKMLSSFRRQWYTQVASVQNAWKTPIMNADDMQYVNMQQSARDMEFTAWMDFQIKVACSMYQIDPMEVNFKYGNVGQKTGLHESSNQEKITESKERGLRPLLRFLAKTINQNILWPINESFVFEFVGLDAQTRDEMLDRAKKRVTTLWTVDELRAEQDLEPLPDGKGEVILDPTYLQHAMAKEGGGDPEGGFGGEGGDEETGDEAGDDDYERMLRQFEEDDEAEERDEEEEDEKRKQTEKSLRSYVVNL